MRVVTRLTGLNPDTIRAWERRYSAISPERTGGNTRLFSPADVRRLVLLRDAVSLGHAVSRVASLDTEALEKLLKEDASKSVVAPSVAEPVAPAASLEQFVEDYLALVDRLEAARSREYLQRAAMLMPTRELLLTIAAPLLARLALRWGDDPAGELRRHIVRVDLRACLTQLRPLYPGERGAPRVLAASPVTGCHDLGVLASAIIASLRGLDVIYLGSGVSPETLLHAVDTFDPAIVLFGVDKTLGREQELQRDAVLPRIPPRVQVWLGPNGPLEGNDPPTVRRIPSLQALEAALADVHHRA